MKRITGYLIDVEHNIAATITIDKTLDAYYRILNCDCFDIARRRIGGQEFDIICDDEALLKDNPKISAIDSDGNPMLCGNLFIVKFDGVDDVTSLDGNDVAFLSGYIHSLATNNYPTPYPMLTECDY